MKNVEKLVRAGGDDPALTASVETALVLPQTVWAFRQVAEVRLQQERLEKAVEKAQGIIQKAIEEAKAAMVYRPRGAAPPKEPAAVSAAKGKIKELRAEIAALEEKNGLLIRVVMDQIREIDEMREVRQWRTLGGPMPGHLATRIQTWYEEKVEVMGLAPLEGKKATDQLQADPLDWQSTLQIDSEPQELLAPTEAVEEPVAPPARMRVSYIVPADESPAERRKRQLFPSVWRRGAQRVMIPA